MCSEGWIAAFTSSNSPGYLHVLDINPHLYVSNLDVAAADLLFSTQDFEIFVGHLLVRKVGPVFGENVVV